MTVIHLGWAFIFFLLLPLVSWPQRESVPTRIYTSLSLAKSKYFNDEQIEILRQDEAGIKKDIQVLRQKLNEVITNVDNDTILSLQELEKYKRARGILDCADQKLGMIPYLFRPRSRSYTGKTWFVCARHILLSPLYFEQAEAWRKGILLHEATHICGTSDAYYIDDKRKVKYPRDTTFTFWYSVADVYRYWAVEGFCLPGPGCYKHWKSKNQTFAK
jgi:hypothetical protein